MSVAQSTRESVECGLRFCGADGRFDVRPRVCEEGGQVRLALKHSPFKVRVLRSKGRTGLIEVFKTRSGVVRRGHSEAQCRSKKSCNYHGEI